MTSPKVLHSTRWASLLDREGFIYVSRRDPGSPPRPDAVIVIAWHLDPEGVRRLVVIEEFRPILNEWHFGLPAGLLEVGEEPVPAAIRELREETGFEAVHCDGTSQGRLYSSAGMSDEIVTVVTLHCTGAPAINPGVGSERIKVMLLDQDGARRLLAEAESSNRAISARLWLLLQSIATTGGFAGVQVGKVA